MTTSMLRELARLVDLAPAGPVSRKELWPGLSGAERSGAELLAEWSRASSCYI
jgi:hypothetical protein